MSGSPTQRGLPESRGLDVREAVRLRRSHQRGMTLLEAIVALALVAVAIVALVIDLSAAQRTVTVAQDQAAADAQLRYVSDYLRDHTAAPYQLCAGLTTYSIPNPPAGPPLNPTNPVTAVTLSGGATRNGLPIAPLEDCKTLTAGSCPLGGGSCCPSTSLPRGCDYGVQELTITQSVGSTTLKRTIWKSVP